MNQINKDLPAAIATITAARFDVWNLAGDRNKEKRRQLMQNLTGEKQTLASSGVNAIDAVLNQEFNHYKDASCQAHRPDALKAAIEKSTAKETPLDKLINDLGSDAQCLLDSPRNIYDASHEHADSSSTVIYTGEAMELVNGLSSTELANAESEADELRNPEKPQTFAEHATLIAFCHVRQAYQEEVKEELENLKDELETLAEDADADADELEEEADELEEDGKEDAAALKLAEAEEIRAEVKKANDYLEAIQTILN